MNDTATQAEKQKQTYTAVDLKNLTGSQSYELEMVSHIIAREIQKSGSFKEKLGDYSYAYSRTQEITAGKAEDYIREKFKQDHGQSMKEMMDGLKLKEEKLDEHTIEQARAYARNITDDIKQGDVPFYRAYDDQGIKLSERFGVTEKKAKSMIKTSFEENSDLTFYAHHKELEKAHYKPQHSQQQQQQKQTRSPSR